MNKKLLIITQHYPPEIGAASNRLEHLSRHLQSNGYQVYVLTSQPKYPNKTLYNKMSFKQVEQGRYIYRVPVLTIGKNNILTRIIQQISFLIVALCFSVYLGIRYKIRICITSSPPFLINFFGLLFKLMPNNQWIMEVRDLWPDSLLAVSKVKSTSILFKILKQMEHYFYSKATKIVVVTRHAKKLLINNLGIEDDKIFVVTNGIPDWIKYSKIKKDESEKEFRIVYAGNLGISQNLFQVLEVAEILTSYPDIKFTFIGDGLEKTKLINYAVKKNLFNVHFVPPVLQKEELIEWYDKSHMGIVSLHDTDFFTNVIPSKLFEYGAVGLTILYVGSGEGAQLVREYNLGTIVDHNPKEIAKKILEYRNSKRKIQSTIDRFRNDYSWDNICKRYIELIEDKNYLD